MCAAHDALTLAAADGVAIADILRAAFEWRARASHEQAVHHEIWLAGKLSLAERRELHLVSKEMAALITRRALNRQMGHEHVADLRTTHFVPVVMDNVWWAICAEQRCDSVATALPSRMSQVVSETRLTSPASRVTEYGARTPLTTGGAAGEAGDAMVQQATRAHAAAKINMTHRGDRCMPKPMLRA